MKVLAHNDQRQRKVSQEERLFQVNVLIQNILIIQVEVLCDFTKVLVALIAPNSFQSSKEFEGTLSQGLRQFSLIIVVSTKWTGPILITMIRITVIMV